MVKQKMSTWLYHTCMFWYTYIYLQENSSELSTLKSYVQLGIWHLNI